MATIREKFEALPIEIVTDFLKTGESEGIPADVQRFIVAIDKVPAFHRRYPSINKCCRVLVDKFPEIFTSFRYTQEIVYASINYFHLNNDVTNAAWDNYYADKQDELAQMAVLNKDFKAASIIYERARRYRTNKDENAYDPQKIRPHTYVLSPEAPPHYFGLEEDYDLKTLWSRKNELAKEAKDLLNSIDDIDDAQREKVMKEVRQNLNIVDTPYEESGNE